MKRQVVWSESASKELENQIRYIWERNQGAALKIARILREDGDRMGVRPIGCPGKRPGTYERVVSGTPYILAYSLEAQTVTILHVFHVSQNWQNIMLDEE